MQNRRYELKLTDNNVANIIVPRRIFIDDLVDITLIGKRTLEYGQALNENILHLLEHFACPAKIDNSLMPDPDGKLHHVLSNPLVGQLWYNNTIKRLCNWNGTRWEILSQYGDISGNSGFIYDGEELPIPINGRGVGANKSNCSFHVSPMFIGKLHGKIECEVIDNVVNCAYYDPEWFPNGETRNPTYASYIIMCNEEENLIPTPTPTPTPTPIHVPTIWDALHTGTGGIILSNVFTNADVAFSPATRTTKRIGQRSYISGSIISPVASPASFLGIGDGSLDTTVQGFRPGLTPFGIEITNTGEVIIGSTIVHTISTSTSLDLEFAIKGRMVWVRKSGDIAWIGGGNPTLSTSPTVHIPGNNGLYIMAGSLGNDTSTVIFHNTPQTTTGPVPVAFSAASFTI